ncbi:hypothetical protein [Prosthecobacter sp.]|jgi:hypothetical protein|uniref:hypothetical protein n=1 Tax=Prosthecobacter sp. TaxID=1965333 RepID=UPI00378405BB
MRLGYCLTLCLILVFALGGPVWAAAPPADGILDETRALTEETHRQLAYELKLFREDLKCDAWITASSFTANGVTLRRQAQITRSEWSGQRPAVLMAYDRATNSSAISFAPVFWERYSAAELVEIMQDTRRTLIDPKLSLDERIAVATRHWIDRLRVMESIRLKQSLWVQRGEKNFSLALVIVLAGASALAAVLGLASRLREQRTDRRFRFPEVHVSMRFGAPYGGGVTAEIKADANAQ